MCMYVDPTVIYSPVDPDAAEGLSLLARRKRIKRSLLEAYKTQKEWLHVRYNMCVKKYKQISGHPNFLTIYRRSCVRL